MFWKKKKQPDDKSKIILGMIMIADENSFELKYFLTDFNNNYDPPIENPSGDNYALAFTIEGESVMIGHVGAPIPSADIEETAQYAYNWTTAVNDLRPHKSHLIVSIMSGVQNQIERFKIFTRVISSLLRTTNSIGVYKGSQSLLIPKKDYLSAATLMNEDNLPLNLWIYFGLRTTTDGRSGYTYGLKEFNKTEMEIINSSKSLEDIREFLFYISHYILTYDVTFKEGQTCGFSEEERIPITLSKSKFVKGDSFKLAY